MQTISRFLARVVTESESQRFRVASVQDRGLSVVIKEEFQNEPRFKVQ